MKWCLYVCVFFRKKVYFICSIENKTQPITLTPNKTNTNMNVHECFTEIHKVNDICVMEKEEEKKEKKTIRTHTSTDSLIHEIVYGMVWSYGIECMKESRYTQI